MPHMMPMMWVFTFITSFLMLFILTSMIYFFYLPKISPSMNKKNMTNLHKWNWMW